MRADGLRRQLQDLHNKAAQESRKDSDASSKAARAREQASRSSSSGLASMKLREADRYEKQALDARKKRADIDRRIADATGRLHTEESRIAREQTDSFRRLEEEILQRSVAERASVVTSMQEPTYGTGADIAEYDFFVSHAGLDKASVARPLAEALRAREKHVWLDEWHMKVGDSIRSKIDEGLRKSRYGIVVLSKDFLEGRHWTEQELNGLFVREEQSGEPRILLIWHNVTKEEVARYSPILADKVALKSADYTIEEMATILVERLIS
ncbi:MAG: TIR domain-containing protein [Actinobacteria bacterium]|nr:TIR domain-containing protein [Actinomycetota bacterium]